MLQRLWKAKPSPIAKHTQLTQEQRRKLRDEIRKLKQLTLSVEQEVIQTYHLSLKILSTFNFIKEEHLPAEDFSKSLSKTLPHIDSEFSYITRTFADALYGEKQIANKNLETFRQAFAHMLKYFREVERTGQELIVTDHRKPVLKIIPLKRSQKCTETVFKPYRHHIVYYEDITAPTVDEWKEV